MCNENDTKECSDQTCKICAAKRKFCETSNLNWHDIKCRRHIKRIVIKTHKCERKATLTRKWGHQEIESESETKDTCAKDMPSDSECHGKNCKDKKHKKEKKHHKKH
jgi:hypothetical protein